MFTIGGQRYEGDCSLQTADCPNRRLATPKPSRYQRRCRDSTEETIPCPSRPHRHEPAVLRGHPGGSVKILCRRAYRGIRIPCHCDSIDCRTCRTLWPLTETACRHRRCRSPLVWTIHPKTCALAVDLPHNRIQASDRSHEIWDVLSASHSGKGRQI